MDAGGGDRVDLDKILDPVSECDKSFWGRDAFKFKK